MESGMAVGSFLKSSGIAALAVGLAIALPATASAQERGWGGRRDGQPAGQAAQQGDAQQGEHRQGRGDGGNRGGGMRSQQAPQAQPPAQVQVQPQAQVQQPQSRWQGNGNGGRGWRRDGVQGSVQPAERPAWRGQDRGGDNRWRGNDGQARGGNDGRWDGNRRGDNDGRVNRGRDGNGGSRWSGSNGRGWNNDWRRDNRYNWSSYRNTNRNVFRLGRYHSPYNSWSYRRLGIGFSLQPLFYSSSYWINDPWQYRLPEAYGPYRWVRYYDDALLVDIYSGEVVDVIYDFFW
jgi:hypothetical protein